MHRSLIPLRILSVLPLFAAASLTVISCGSSAGTPISPSASTGGSTAANPDGSTLKVSVPTAVDPVGGVPGVSTSPTLLAWQSRGLYAEPGSFPHRFQVSDSSSFGSLLADGIGVNEGQTLVRFRPSLPTSRQVFWRLRAESDGLVGPWSAVATFSTGGTATTPPPSPSPGGGPRTPDPAPGQRLPLPTYVQEVVAQFADASDSCPLGVKYVNNPWQDRVMDRLRQIDTRWGYNAKPTRTPADNGGRPVIAAGDEIAYHFSAGPDQGSTEVYLIDILEQHCGPTPRITYRHFTGEEPGVWTGAGRFTVR